MFLDVSDVFNDERVQDFFAAQLNLVFLLKLTLIPRRFRFFFVFIKKIEKITTILISKATLYAY